MGILNFPLVALILGLVTLTLLAHAGSPPNCVNVNNQADKIVCVCNRTVCDHLDYIFPQESGSAHLISTTKRGERFQVSDLKFVRSSAAQSDYETIQVDLSKQHQRILGWGGAFTDASGINIRSLSWGVQATLLESYFGRHGLRYNLGRVPIGGSDFSPYNYTYNDLPPGHVDYELRNWSLTVEDYSHKLPVIQQAYLIRQNFTADKLKLYGSPWSPPAWMKDSHSLVRGHLIDDPRIYKAWAKYIAKFYETYARILGFDFWGSTIQNEPASANEKSYFFNSLQMNSSETIKFVSKYLGPALQKLNLKLMVGDDNLGLINKLVPPIMEDPEASKYISGLAFHWYASGWYVPYDNLTECVNKIKDKIEFVLMTEACAGFRKGKEIPVDLGSWERGEQYARDIIQDLLRSSAGWVDWNLALDTVGGPNWAQNTVDSPIIVNAERDEFYKQPMYYALGHFSRFFQPDSVRVETLPFTGGYNDTLMSVAVYNKNRGVVSINLFNKLDVERTISVHVKGEKGQATGYVLHALTLAARSLNTVTLKL